MLRSHALWLHHTRIVSAHDSGARTCMREPLARASTGEGERVGLRIALLVEVEAGGLAPA